MLDSPIDLIISIATACSNVCFVVGMFSARI